MVLVTTREYADAHGRVPRAVRYMAQRGSFETARKYGRDWLIDASEPYPDHRRKEQKR